MYNKLSTNLKNNFLIFFFFFFFSFLIFLLEIGDSNIYRLNFSNNQIVNILL